MTMTRIRLVVLLGCSLLLSACVGMSTEYLSLQAQGPPGPSQSLDQGQTAVLVEPVEMPASLDRLYLTRSNGPAVMEVSGHIRWIAPLGGMMQRVLAEDLRREEPDDTVLLAGSPVPDRLRRLELRVEVQEFLPTSRGTILLDADYFLLNAEGTLLYAGHFRFQAASGPAAEAEAQTMSAAVAALAHTIAQHLPPPNRRRLDPHGTLQGS